MERCDIEGLQCSHTRLGMPSLIVCKHVLTATQAFGTLKESLRSNGRGPCRVKVGLPQLPTDLRRTNICITPIHRSCNFTDLVHHLYSAPHRIGSMAPVLPSTQAAFRGPHDARLAYKNRGAWAPFSFHPPSSISQSKLPMAQPGWKIYKE